jgi:hypothetical protein
MSNSDNTPCALCGDIETDSPCGDTECPRRAEQNYYQSERIQVVCEIDIQYKQGSAECRADVVRLARASLHLDMTGAGPHGCYTAHLVPMRND